MQNPAVLAKSLLVFFLVSNVQAGDFPVVWEMTEGLMAPESIYYDESSGFLFLSQIRDGGGDKKDGDGWISKLTIDGKMLEPKWATGLNAPKGLRSHNGKLWVSDIDRIVGYRISDGKQLHDVVVRGAKFLNDLAIDGSGTVFVADMVSSRIYQFKDGILSVFVEGEQFEHPNGLLVVGNRLIVAAWGTGFQDDFTTKVGGHLYSLDLKTKKKTLITSKPIGNLDGIELDGRGGYFVTDWIAGKVIHIAGDGTPRVIQQFAKGAADHAYLPKRKLLILPHMLENNLKAFDLSSLVRSDRTDSP